MLDINRLIFIIIIITIIIIIIIQLRQGLSVGSICFSFIDLIQGITYLISTCITSVASSNS